MPWGDGTGPLGLGPMTGRRAGYCAGFPVPGCMNPIGFGGWGRGRRFRFWARVTGLPGWYRARVGLPPFGAPQVLIPVANPYASREDEIKSLEEERRAIAEEIKALREELKEVERRINELKKKKE